MNIRILDEGFTLDDKQYLYKNTYTFNDFQNNTNTLS